MNSPKKIYWYLLILAIAIYIIGHTILQSQLIIKVGELEHQLYHLTGEGNGRCQLGGED